MRMNGCNNKNSNGMFHNAVTELSVKNCGKPLTNTIRGKGEGEVAGNPGCNNPVTNNFFA